MFQLVLGASVFLGLFASAGYAVGTDRISPFVIYGDDSRRDLYEEPKSALLKLSESSVALILQDNIISGSKGVVDLSAPTFGEHKNLCQEERFYNQETPAFCSGVLIADNLVLTAGHCMEDRDSCQKTRFVFGFAKTSSTDTALTLPASDVYSCRDAIVSHEEEMDAALVILDRPVFGRAPIELKDSLDPRRGDPVVAIGYPSGLPLKLVDGRIRKTSAGVLETDLDNYGGSSGAPVFSADTEDLVGLVIEGEEDFVKDKSRHCLVSKRCSNRGCSGESVLRTEMILDWLDQNRQVRTRKGRLTAL